LHGGDFPALIKELLDVFEQVGGGTAGPEAGGRDHRHEASDELPGAPTEGTPRLSAQAGAPRASIKPVARKGSTDKGTLSALVVDATTLRFTFSASWFSCGQPFEFNLTRY